MSVDESTFSAPMKLRDGTVIPSTGKKFKVRIVTLVKWKGGRIEEESLFWDYADWIVRLVLAFYLGSIHVK